MKDKMFLFALCLFTCFPKEATTDAEKVWLKEVTTILQTDKQGVTGSDFPDQLSFHLKRRAQNLVLNLKRKYQIDPNIDTYVVQKLKDGRPLLEKTQNSEMAVSVFSETINLLQDVAYYQDMENGAFMTARCVKRSSGQCDILINGNIRLGDRSYTLRPSEADVIPNDFLEIMGLHGKRYILQDQANIESGMSVENNEQTHIIETNVQEKYIDRLRSIPYGQDKPNPDINPDVMFSTLPRGESNYGGTNIKNDKTSNRNNYYVEVAVLADSGIWELFQAIARSKDYHKTDEIAEADLREYLFHIVNGVDQLYKGIEDPSISINVNIRAFVIFKTERLFPHKHSGLHYTGGIGKWKINVDHYLLDLTNWDINTGSQNLPKYDQVILFTNYPMYSGDPENTVVDGRYIQNGACDLGSRVQIVRAYDYFRTTRTVAHQLGHALGALNDGDDLTTPCLPEENFIMSNQKPRFYPGKKYTLNPWIFSRCSVDYFKRTLVNKTCLKTKSLQDQNIMVEAIRVLQIQPGQRYSPDEQCIFTNGYGSKYHGKKLERICKAMRCTYAENKQWDNKYITAAPGTECGDNKYCQKGLCVPVQ